MHLGQCWWLNQRCDWESDRSRTASKTFWLGGEAVHDDCDSKKQRFLFEVRDRSRTRFQSPSCHNGGEDEANLQSYGNVRGLATFYAQDPAQRMLEAGLGSPEGPEIARDRPGQFDPRRGIVSPLNKNKEK